MKLHLSKPSGRRRSFRILKQTASKFETVRSPDLASINSNYLAGRIDFETAEKNVRNLINHLQPKLVPVHNKDNSKVVDQYWAEEYRHRKLKDRDTARYELDRAVRALGNLSIQSATRDQLQEHIDANFKTNKQRRIVSKINQLLKWLRRDFSLVRDEESFEEVNHVTEEEFQTLLTKVPDKFKSLHEVCFYGGFRIGEAFALKPHQLNKKLSSIKVVAQIDKKGVYRKTKNKKERDAYVFPKGIEALERFFVDRQKITLEERTQMSKVTAKAAGGPLTFHDLRHSYAIALISKGVSIALVAQSIGDSVRVVEKHYSGFILTSESLEMIGKIVKAGG